MEIQKYKFGNKRELRQLEVVFVHPAHAHLFPLIPIFLPSQFFSHFYFPPCWLQFCAQLLLPPFTFYYKK